MNGALPLSDDFLYWDPERIMEFLTPRAKESEAVVPIRPPPGDHGGARGDED